MKHKHLNAGLALIAVLLSISVPVIAQRLDGTLRGTVVDSSGAVIPGADVTASNQETGVQQTTKTTSSGAYVFPNLLVGTYTVRVVAKGFTEFERRVFITHRRFHCGRQFGQGGSPHIHFPAVHAVRAGRAASQEKNRKDGVNPEWAGFITGHHVLPSFQ